MEPSPEGPIAFVFWHAPTPSVSTSTYETGIAAFHRALAEHRPRGFLASASYRIARVPWAATPAWPVAYVDWYLLADWSALGTLNTGAVDPSHRSPHDAAAVLSDRGQGSVFALRSGAGELPSVRFEIWCSKPRGTPTDAFVGSLDEAPDPGGSVWQRQLSLGPAPEFCRRSRSPPSHRVPDSVQVELRPVELGGELPGPGR
jgi:hypothetical protein